MRYAIILAGVQTCTIIDCTFEDAKRIAGLDHDIDHGHFSRTLSIAVDGAGLRKPVETQSYFAIAGQLFAGNAILYATNMEGETRSIREKDLPPIFWMQSAALVERNIELGLLDRPTVAVRMGSLDAPPEVVWEWNKEPKS